MSYIGNYIIYKIVMKYSIISAFLLLLLTSTINGFVPNIGTINRKSFGVNHIHMSIDIDSITSMIPHVKDSLVHYSYSPHVKDSLTTIKHSLELVKDTVVHYSPLLVTYATMFAIVSKKMKRRGMMGGPTPGSIIHSSVSFKDVAGCDYAKKELEEVVDFMKNPTKYQRYGAVMPRGVLLSSEPGMGKTHMAKAIAGETNVPLISVAGSEFVSLFVGNGAKRVREVYELARKNSPCFVFIDEIDSIASQRGASVGGGNDEREATLNQLLTEIDGIGGKHDIITIGATNRPELLDSALTRSGRMDRKIQMGSFDFNARMDILNVHFKDKPLSKKVDMSVLSKQTSGMSGSDLANIANEASINAARSSALNINSTHIEHAFDKLTIGIRLPDKDIDANTSRTIAVHEAGHALVSHEVDSDNIVSRISIIPSTSGAAGFTMFIPSHESDSGLHSKSNLEKQILVLLGGRAAEEIVFGTDHVTTGAHDDISRAKKLCHHLVSDFGMGGQIAFSDADSENRANDILNESYIKAKECINRSKLEVISNELIERREISGDRFYELV